jgi:hypothetical protein
MFSQLNWMPLSDYFVYRKCILVYKVFILVCKGLHYLMSDYLNVFNYVTEINQKQSKSSNFAILYSPRVKTEYYKRLFSVSGSNAWNV